MTTKECPVPRVQWGFYIASPVVVPRGLQVNGQQQVSVNVQNIQVNHHELRVFEQSDYMFYCIYCAALQTQYEWQMTFNSDEGLRVVE